MYGGWGSVVGRPGISLTEYSWKHTLLAVGSGGILYGQFLFSEKGGRTQRIFPVQCYWRMGIVFRDGREFGCIA